MRVLVSGHEPFELRFLTGCAGYFRNGEKVDFNHLNNLRVDLYPTMQI
jgi:hypothetical protein